MAAPRTGGRRVLAVRRSGAIEPIRTAVPARQMAIVLVAVWAVLLYRLAVGVALYQSNPSGTYVGAPYAATDDSAAELTQRRCM